MALFSERTEHYVASKNTAKVMNLTSKVVPICDLFGFGTTFEVRFMTLVVFFNAAQCSDRSENSAIRSALKI